MNVRTFVEFMADFDDDAEWSENDDLIKPGGYNILLNIIESLNSRGFELTEPIQHSHYGWETDITVDGATIWMLIQFVDPWLITTEPIRGIKDRIIGKKYEKQHASLLAHLDETLKSNEKFKDIRWLTEDEFNSDLDQKGHNVPIDPNF